MTQRMHSRANAAVRSAFNGRRRLRAWRNTHFGGMEAVKAHPLSICRFRPDEGGTVSTSLNVMLAPVSGHMRSNPAATLFIIMFVVGWNQYLWPALMTTEESLFTIVRGIKQYLQVIIGTNYPEYNKALALAVLALLPPALVVIVFQRWFIRGLLDSER